MPSGDGLRSRGFHKWKMWVLSPEETVAQPQTGTHCGSEMVALSPPVQEMAVSPSHWSSPAHT